MLAYDPEWFSIAGPFLGRLKHNFAIHDVASRRDQAQEFVKSVKTPLREDVEVRIHHTTGSDGHSIAIYQVKKRAEPEPQESAQRTAAALHIHGGGYYSVRARDIVPSIADFVASGAPPLFSVEYRLAPENPYPSPLEDCWTALQWLHSHAAELNVDPERIAIFGESAGGGLGAALAILARDRKLSPPLAKQVLIYPMLDDRTAKDHTDGKTTFSADDNATGWGAYLGKQFGTDSVSPYAAPARVTDVTGLPRLYLDVGQLDLYVQEDTEYVSKFVRANVPVEFHLYDGVPHFFQRLAPGSSVARRAFENRLEALQTI